MTRLRQAIRFAWRVSDAGTQGGGCGASLQLQLFWGGYQQTVASFGRPDLSPALLQLAAVDLTNLNKLLDAPIDNMAWLVHAAHIFCLSVKQASSLTSQNWLNDPRPWPHPVDSINEVLRATRGHLVLEEQMVALLSLAGVPPSEREEKIAHWQCGRHDPFGEASIDGSIKLRAIVESAALPSRQLVTDWPDSELKDALRLAHNWYAERTFGGILSPFKSPGRTAAGTDSRASSGGSRCREGLPTCSLCGAGSNTRDCVVGANFVLCRSCFADALNDRLAQNRFRILGGAAAQTCANCSSQNSAREGLAVAEGIFLCLPCTTGVLSAFLELTDE